MNEKLAQVPHVVKWGSLPYDLEDQLGRFGRSEWNYFLKDRENGVLAGYWEAEQGHEDLGGDEFHEVLHVVAGTLYVRPEGEDEETVAGPGDTVVVVAGRRVRVSVREAIKGFLYVFQWPTWTRTKRMSERVEPAGASLRSPSMLARGALWPRDVPISFRAFKKHTAAMLARRAITSSWR